MLKTSWTAPWLARNKVLSQATLQRNMRAVRFCEHGDTCERCTPRSRNTFVCSQFKAIKMFYQVACVVGRRSTSSFWYFVIINGFIYIAVVSCCPFISATPYTRLTSHSTTWSRILLIRTRYQIRPSIGIYITDSQTFYWSRAAVTQPVHT